MIQLLGSQEGREAQAARELRDLILASWAWVEQDDGAELSLLAGVKCHGQKRRDLDLVLLATFTEPVPFRPFLDITWGDGPPFRPKVAAIDSLCVVIELKEHDTTGVRFTGADRVEVRYYQGGREHWSSATDQSEEQKFSLIGYLQAHGVAAPYVSNLIWLKHLSNKQLPSRPHNMLGGNSTWEMFLNVLLQLDRKRSPDGKWLLAARRPEAPRTFDAAMRLLTRTLRPTSLDRMRMDRITQAAVQADWLDLLGTRQLIFRGRGGSGKTMLLLQLAWKAYEERNERVLLLTYNRALAADLRRLLTLLGVPDDFGVRSLQIRTVHSFIYALLKGLGYLSGPEEDFLNRYEEIKDEVLGMLHSGAITQADVDHLMAQQSLDFRWDSIFIDEAQDWPENERDLLRHLYPPGRFVLADGIDQLVRGRECDWQGSLPAGRSRTFYLPTCLRLKGALARFANELAPLLGLGNWRVTPNAEAMGGRVVMVEGDYFQDRTLHEELLAAGAAAGNEPVDLLGCVPPALVERDAVGNWVESVPARRLRAWGFQVWDGASADVRSSYPVSPRELRVVQYDSCRGLEGWVTLLWGLDEFFAYKEESGRSVGEPGPDNARQAFLHAARWLMIPLTRAIDTLVIQVGTRDTPLKRMLRQVADTCIDFVEWRTM
jgi:hypothetical protein